MAQHPGGDDSGGDRRVRPVPPDAAAPARRALFGVRRSVHRLRTAPGVGRSASSTPSPCTADHGRSTPRGWPTSPTSTRPCPACTSAGRPGRRSPCGRSCTAGGARSARLPGADHAGHHRHRQPLLDRRGRRPGHLRCRGRRRLGDPSLEPGPPRPGLGAPAASTASPNIADTAENHVLVTAGSFAVALLTLSAARRRLRSINRPRRSTTCSPSEDRSCSPTPAAKTATRDRRCTFRNSTSAGVDVLDLNVTLTADDVLVVQHDLTVDRTTNGTGTVAEMSFADLADLDNAYWFTPDCGTCTGQPDDAYVHRGVRTGDVPARRVHLGRLRRPDAVGCRRRVPRHPAQRRDQGNRPAGPGDGGSARRRVGSPRPPPRPSSPRSTTGSSPT